MPFKFCQFISTNKKLVIFSCSLLIAHLTKAQTADSLHEKELQEVVIKAFEQNRKLKEVPAAVNYIGQQTLNRFSPTSVVSAINTTPGVHMEERSPGSYRLSIRGSSLRSPFGVRNVKIYYNDIPYTDPGGNTYLNGLGFYNYHSIEVIKGPGSSLYGAGTGGVMLIEGLNTNESNGIIGQYTTGSYHLQNAMAQLTTGNDSNKSQVSFQHLQNDGYRNHSALRKDVFSWNGNYHLNKNQQLKTTFLYSDLFYETPGALTLSEYNADAKAARPATGVFPSSEQSKAAVYQRSFLAGLSFTQYLSTSFKNTTSLYGAYTDFSNPAVRNYGKNKEPHTGGRTVFTFQKKINQALLSFNAGAELQQNFTSVEVYNNKLGNIDSLQSLDEEHTQQAFTFLQSAADWNNWILTAGASINRMRVNFDRLYPVSVSKQQRTFNNEIAPRIALAKTLAHLTFYSSIAKGFSPPSVAELLPSGSAINLQLNAEHGTNYDLGIRGDFLNSLLYVDVNAFMFSLSNTIVQRRDAGGGDYYTNAGKTAQNGIETYISYPIFHSSVFFERSLLWVSHTWHHFRYKSFKQNSNDFSGNQMPGEAPHTISTGFDLATINGFDFNISYFFSDKIALNDANTAYANAYHLVTAKLGYEKRIKNKSTLQIFVGADNILNQKYSLGNDINAFGGRYYNAAPGRNYYGGISVGLDFKKK